MNDSYNFKHTCPDFNEYKLFVEGTGSENFKKAFHKHLLECTLCAEAIDGWQSKSIIDISNKLEQANTIFKRKTQKHYSNQRLIAYAATILLIVGIFSIAIQSNHTNTNYEQANLFDHSLLIQETIEGQKTLSKKSNEQYMYIGDCNTIAFNDQIINKKDIDKLNMLSSASLLRVEVASKSNECAVEVIENIKRTHNIPVITIKERKHL